ncbi:formyltransferase family protein [uncultured Dokdonia sp.]|uniref:formyltransferase family protein n=1 Tax=uncultured Dokdonia sp. TaxID=575653 RepID=UPI00262DB310|nr:formyltransferase family protein [uncultured Dokdonia sp.]
MILCGYNWIGCKVLSLLLSKGYDVFVYTHENPSYINSLIEYCDKKEISYSLEKIKLNNLPFKPDIVCSIYYRYIIPKDIIEITSGKIFNLHPSLLPEYKGCSSLTWALIEGENNVGYTYHYIEGGIDTGNIILQEIIEIEERDTQITLYHRVMFEASKSFMTAFNRVLNGYEGESQKSMGKYYKRGCPHNGDININWSELKIERFIRAMNYPPLPYATFKGKEVKTFTDFKNIT